MSNLFISKTGQRIALDKVNYIRTGSDGYFSVYMNCGMVPTSDEGILLAFGKFKAQQVSAQVEEEVIRDEDLL